MSTRTDKGTANFRVTFDHGTNSVDARELQLVVEEAIARSVGTVTGNVYVMLDGVVLTQVTDSPVADAPIPEFNGSDGSYKVGEHVIFEGVEWVRVAGTAFENDPQNVPACSFSPRDHYEHWDVVLPTFKIGG